MRSLISFKNSKNKAKRVTLAIENDYGADDDEVVRGSAKAPNLFYSKPDSWAVVADDAITAERRGGHAGVVRQGSQ